MIIFWFIQRIQLKTTYEWRQLPLQRPFSKLELKIILDLSILWEAKYALVPTRVCLLTPAERSQTRMTWSQPALQTVLWSIHSTQEMASVWPDKVINGVWRDQNKIANRCDQSCSASSFNHQKLNCHLLPIHISYTISRKKLKISSKFILCMNWSRDVSWPINNSCVTLVVGFLLLVTVFCFFATFPSSTASSDADKSGTETIWWVRGE